MVLSNARLKPNLLDKLQSPMRRLGGLKLPSRVSVVLLAAVFGDVRVNKVISPTWAMFESNNVLTSAHVQTFGLTAQQQHTSTRYRSCRNQQNQITNKSFLMSSHFPQIIFNFTHSQHAVFSEYMTVASTDDRLWNITLVLAHFNSQKTKRNHNAGGVIGRIKTGMIHQCEESADMAKWPLSTLQ